MLMKRFHKNLHPLAIEYLYEGLVLTESIYNYNGRTMLLPKGEVLDEYKIWKLKKFNHDYRNICVHTKTFQELISNHSFLDNLDDKLSYSGLIKDSQVFYDGVKISNRISEQKAFELVSSISEKNVIQNPALIFQCINTERPIDQLLCRHSINVSMLNALIGKWLNLSQDEIVMLMFIGVVHDIGKIKIPQDILDAPRKLTEEEFDIVRKHPIFSYELLDAEGVDTRIKMAVRHHHEKCDGKGYPDGISNNQISLYAKITAISDVYDAMVSKRSYKSAICPFHILNQFFHQEYSGLDNSLSDIFVNNMCINLRNKNVLMSNGTIGTIDIIMPNDIEHPIVSIDGLVLQTNENCNCTRIIFNT